MKKINFAIIGSLTENTLDLKNEIKKRGFFVSVFSLNSVFLEFNSNNFIARNKKISLNDFDIFLFRAYNKNFREARILAEALLAKNKIVIDTVLGLNMINSKIYEASKLNRAGINYPKTWQSIWGRNYNEILKKIDFPLIVKPIYGQKGQGVEKIENEQDFIKFFETNPKGYLMQEFFKIDGDIRVFIVNGKILGGIKRYLTKNDFRSNISLGAKIKKIDLTDEMKKIAIKAANAMQYEIAGVDLIEYKNKIYVLEVNSTPQWQGFKKATGINPAKEIITYALKKYEKI